MYNLYKNIINGSWERPVFYFYKKKNLLKSTGYLGGDTGTRTLDPMIKSHLLYQLSYVPKTEPKTGINTIVFKVRGLFCHRKNKKSSKNAFTAYRVCFRLYSIASCNCLKWSRRIASIFCLKYVQSDVFFI